MSYAAEPYVQFVDDLVTALTGGVIRERFTFLPSEAPFRLSPPGPIVASTLLVYGQASGTFRRFNRGRDYDLVSDVVQWRADASASKPAADAVWPDEATPFFVNYDHKGPSAAAPPLSDRNTGSITRLLGESFARELAVVSRQLEAVYRAGFLATAEGRDLDQLVALLGLARRDRTYAVGTVIFARSSVAPADIFIPAGTKLSTREPPPIVFETAEDRVLRRGNLTVDAPVRAEVSGPPGVVAADTITVIHRPILGVESVSNPLVTQLAGADESDDGLRARARRALETSGRATIGALTGALTGLATTSGALVREKDIRIDEDRLNRPGLITLNVAADLDAETCAQAIALIEQTRPAGVRVVHNLSCVLPNAATPLRVQVDDDSDLGSPVASDIFEPVVIHAVVLPAVPSPTADRAKRLVDDARGAIEAFVAQAGIGEVLVYNRLIAALIAVDGIQDAAAILAKRGDAKAPLRANLIPKKTLRPKLVDPAKDIVVTLADELVSFDVTVTVVLDNFPGGDKSARLEDARLEIASLLQDAVASMTEVTHDALLGSLKNVSDNYHVTDLSYTVQYSMSVKPLAKNPDIALSGNERPWISSVTLDGASS